MKKLPFLVSVPHGGTERPPEIAERVAITPRDLFDDSDACTQEIYAMKDGVVSFHAASVARAFVDLNRAPDRVPPAFPDGVVKSITCYGRPIYKPGAGPGPAEIEALLENHYHPYHRALAEALRDPALVLALDCHSMAATAPAIAPDTGKRPLVNLGDADGTACDPLVTAMLKEAFERVFGIPGHEVVCNRPFRGGYLTRTYGHNPVPWIQVELNRSFYLSPPWFSPADLTVDPARLRDLNARFRSVLQLFHGRLAESGHVPGMPR